MLEPAAAQPSSDWQVFLQLDGLLLETPEKAADFAEAVVRARFGTEAAEGQRPFVAIDRGDTWEVRGTKETDALLPFIPGSCSVVLRKKTGEIVDMQLHSSYRPGGGTAVPR